MAKKQNKKQPQREQQASSNTPPLPGKPDPKDSKHPPLPGHAILREIFESLAVAIMLALFIRTFVAEPFVIPTGSMAPTLMGAHKDVLCPICGERFKVNSSMDPANDPRVTAAIRCAAGMCPMCRYTVPFEPQVAAQFPTSPEHAVPTPTYSGDRIVVNKFLYSFRDPERWDVVVFKYPGHASDNYIKRLVGLPEESLMIYQGDLFVGDAKASEVEDFAITPKPPTTAMALRHPVHDTYRDPAILYDRGWPHRWSADESQIGWKIDVTTTDDHAIQRFACSGAEESWLRYRHFVPTQRTWDEIEQGITPVAQPKLIDDFYSYNAAVQLGRVQSITARPFHVSPIHQGIHWVGDLMVEADVDVGDTKGEVVLELVEAGHRFRAILDLATGLARFEILPWGSETTTQLAKEGATPLNRSGKHLVRFANVDDQLLLWVDEEEVSFDSPTQYSSRELFGERGDLVPRTSESDPGDLAPVGIASRGATLVVDRLRVWRDVYYIATQDSVSGFDDEGGQDGGLIDYADFPADDLLTNPRKWGAMALRRREIFDIGKDQFFVLGDNSPASQDARLWHNPSADPDTRRVLSYPGGNYLERRLLIGRAVGVVWPHTWNYVIPGFSDMRLIR